MKFEDGSPVPYGMVRFVNDSYETFGNINDGVVEIGDADGGVPPGVYKIAVQATIDEGEKRGESIIKTKYASVNTSGLEITVEENKSIDIVVEKP
ncbi:hypothetical protein C5Y93_16870 [Blastopirellula marina]|uniref:Uncharacterized protein n=1 Tax=Blastopirellula marina TaxID=124 RepID=A0A2S8GK15_9BACT|nr:hypothetical protein C5Y93_16870 [Blastopirellula marina]